MRMRRNRLARRTLAFALLLLLTFLAAPIVQAAGNGDDTNCSLSNLSGCVPDSVRDTVSSAINSASDWVSDRADRASNWVSDKVDSASNWVSDKVDSASNWASDAAGRARERISDAVSSGVESIGSSAQSQIQQALEFAGGESRRAADAIRRGSSQLLRQAYDRGNDFVRGVYGGGAEFLHSLSVDEAAAIAMAYLPDVDPAAVWRIAGEVANDAYRRFGYAIGSDPEIDAAINYAIDRVASMRPDRLWNAASDISEELNDEFGYAIANSAVVQFAIQKATDLARRGASSQDTNCRPMPYLRVGERARVSPGTPNRVRSAPSVNAPQVGKLNAGEEMFIVGGPVCEDGYFWYQAIADDVSGWTAAGGSDGHWLEPLPGTSATNARRETAASSQTNRQTNASSGAARQSSKNNCPMRPRLAVGSRARNVSSSGNRVRSSADTGASQIGRIAVNEVVYVEAGPVCADGYNWFRVRSQSVTGWTAEGGDGEYWIVTIR